MASWIFQGNPDYFDVTGYLEERARITWQVRQSASTLARGDVVYLWRAKGSTTEPAGIIASGIIDSDVWTGPDEPGAMPFWPNPSEGEAPSPRVWIRIVKKAAPKERLTARALREDPVLRGMRILRQPAGTNFPLTGAEAERLRKLWEIVGVPWTSEESLAGLYVYALTLESERISIRPDSPLVRVSLRIGRTVSSVYQKVMNYRSLDPRDVRAGRDGASRVDADLWQQFYDEAHAVIDFDRLEAAFLHAWGGVVPMPALNTKDAAPPPKGATQPGRRRMGEVLLVVRDSQVTKWVKEHYGYACQACGITVRGRDFPYAEGAHVRPLGRPHLGPDTTENVLCLCPNHHRMLDYGGILIEEDFTIVDRTTGRPLGSLYVKPPHMPSMDHLRYHRQLFASERPTERGS